MIPNNKIFYNKNEIIYDGKLYSRLYRMIDSPGRYILHFEFISTNSDYEQCIGLSLFKFKGAVYINGERVKLGRGEFTGMQFSERTAPQKFNVEIDMKSGVISIYNSARGWREDIINHTPSAVPAMIVDKTGENSYVFHCNDYVYDDDFDDLVFSLEVTKLERQLAIKIKFAGAYHQICSCFPFDRPALCARTQKPRRHGRVHVAELPLRV